MVATGLLWALLSGTASAKIYQRGDDCIGMVNWYTVKSNESLVEIARYFDLGFNEISDANPQVDPFIPPPGAEIQLPLSWLLPCVPVREGIVINLAEMRLYYFVPGSNDQVMTFPVGIGESGRDTPLGSFRISEKIVDPVWHVPLSIRRERPELPAMVPPGQDNPLGSRALRLSQKDVLIHGTNRPWGQGRKVSHGCVRLYPEDILQLYAAVPVGVRVTIIDQPVKVGTRGKKIYAEIHAAPGCDHLTVAMALVNQQALGARIDLQKLKVAIYQKNGIPIDITG